MKRYIFFTAVAAFAIRVIWIFAPEIYLLKQFVIDDAFYYISTAQNIVSGLGSTFDGIHPANGYHPLWMAILALAYLVPFLSAHALQTAVFLSSACFAVSVYIAGKVIDSYSNNKTETKVLVALYAFNPFIYYESLNGLETSIALLCLALFFWLIRKVETSDSDSDRNILIKFDVGIGVVGGLLVLARLDFLFFLIAYGIWWLIRNREIKRLIIVGVISFIVASPWFIWNMYSNGMLIQSSATGGTVVFGSSLLSLQSLYTHFKLLIKQLLATSLYFGLPLVIMYIIMFFFQPERQLWVKIKELLKENSSAVCFMFGFLLLLSANAFLRGLVRSWYIAPALLIAPLVVSALHVRMPKKLYYAALLVAVVSISIFSYKTLINRGEKVGNAVFYSIAKNLPMYVPPGAQVGIFDAGIIKFYSRVQIVNLDGLINVDAYRALQNKNLYGFLSKSDIRYIVTPESYISKHYDTFFGQKRAREYVEKVRSLSDSKDPLTLYIVKR